MSNEERIELKLEEVEAWEDALVAAQMIAQIYEERLKKAEWELHHLMLLPDTITDVFDEENDEDGTTAC